MTDVVGREFDWEIESDLDSVWQALTTAEGLATWYVSNAEIDAREGGELKVDWGTGPFAMGSFEAFDPPRRLKLRYGGDQVGAEEWLLTHEEGVTHVRLIHSLPVDEGKTWDDMYPDIVRGWSLFIGTLAWTLAEVGELGRQSEVRLGDIAEGAWQRVIAALALDTTPAAGATISLPDLPDAEVLIGVDDYSLLLAFEDRATLLVDVEGPHLYTLAATYGDATSDTDLLATVTALAQRLCTASGAAP